MYKDKDKQREANRERQRRYRVTRGLKACPKGVTNSRCDKQGVTERDGFDKMIEKSGMMGPSVTHDLTHGIVIRPNKPKRGKDIKESVEPEVMVEIDDDGNITPVKQLQKPKRGLDIKCFEDLPPDVQQTIDIVSVVEGKID